MIQANGCVLGRIVEQTVESPNIFLKWARKIYSIQRTTSSYTFIILKLSKYSSKIYILDGII